MSLVLLYLAACVFLYVKQIDLVFFPRALVVEQAQGFEALEVRRQSDAVELHGWLQQKDGAEPFIFYYGGNAEEVSNKLHLFPQLNIHNFLLMNYRGFGLSEGAPSEQALKNDALTLYDDTVTRLALKPEQIILFGNSLGTGIATYVASQRPVAKVILNTPYDSVVNVGQKRFPIMPVKLLSHQRFESIKLAPNINLPMLCIIAEQDQVIPPSHAMNLAKKWQGEVTQVTIKGAGHVNIFSFAEAQQVIRDYIE